MINTSTINFSFESSNYFQFKYFVIALTLFEPLYLWDNMKKIFVCKKNPPSKYESLSFQH